VLRVAAKYKGGLAEWIVSMRSKKPERVVAVALANKLARIGPQLNPSRHLWARLTASPEFLHNAQDRIGR
jgi:hypothetical protein